MHGVATRAGRLGVDQPCEGRGLGEARVSAHVPPGRYPSLRPRSAPSAGPVPGVPLSGGRAGHRISRSRAPRPPLGAIRPSASSTASSRGSTSTPACLALAEDAAPAAARAGQVPRHLQPEPRRVLRGPGLGSHGAARRRPAHAPRPTASTSSTSSARSGSGSNELVGRAAAVFAKEIAPALDDDGIRFADWDDLSDDDRAHLDDLFAESIFPVLTPLAVDPAHPFPYISNLSLNLAVTVRDPSSGDERFARVKVPPLLPRFVPLPDGERFVLLEQLIAAKLDAPVPRHGGARAPPVPRHPRRRLRARGRSRRPPRGDRVGPAPAQQVRPRRAARGRHQDDRRGARAALPRARAVRRRRQRDRRPARPRRPLVALRARPARAQGRAVGAADARSCSQGSDPAARLLPAARRRPTCSCTTPTTRSPRRSSSSSSRPPATRRSSRSSRPSTAPPGAESALVGSLVKAAEQGKQVVALVELKARFDEQANIARARVLEEAGVHVVYGLVGLKTHAKVLLVVRQEAEGIRRYCHVGTGNYNPKTADLYEDLGLLIGRPRARRRPHRPLQPPHRLQPPGRLPQAAGRARRTCGTRSPTASSSRRPWARAGRITHEDEQPGRPGADRRALRRVAARAPRSTSSCGASAACDPRCRGCRRTSGCGRSSVASSSTPGSTASAPTPKPPSTSSVRPTSCPATSTAGSRRSRRSPIRACARGWRRCSTLNLADDTLAWELARRRHLAQDPDRRPASPRTARSRSSRSPARTPPDPRRGSDATRSASSSSRPGPSSGVPTVDDPSRACTPSPPDDHPAPGRLLRHRRLPAGTRRREPALPQRRGLDGQAAGHARRRARSAPELHSTASPGDPPEAARRPRARAAPGARRSSSVARAQHRAHTASCCATPTGTQIGRSSTTRCRCSTAPAWRRASASSRWSSASRAPTTLVDARSPTGLRAAGAGEPEHAPEDRARARPPRARPARRRRRRRSSTSRPRPPRWSRPRSSTSTLRLLANDPGVRLGDDPEARPPGARRDPPAPLRPAHLPAGPRRTWSEPIRDELKWLGGLLGAVRDTEVLLDRLEERLAELPTVRPSTTGKRLLDKLRASDASPSACRAARRDAVRRATSRCSTASSPRRAPVHDSSGDPADDSTSSWASSQLSEAVAQAPRRVNALGDDPPDHELHAVAHPRQAVPVRRRGGRSRGRQARETVRRGRRSRSRRCSASTRTRWSPGSGCATTADGGGRVECAFVAGELAAVRTSPPTPARDQWPAAWKQAKRQARCGSGCEPHLGPSAPPVASSATGAVDGGPEVLLVHRPRYDDWSLPKGKAEPGERDEETALREVEEETGLRCTLGAPAGRDPLPRLEGTGQGRALLAHGAARERGRDRVLRPERRGRRAAVVHNPRGRRAPHVRTRPRAAAEG